MKKSYLSKGKRVFIEIVFALALLAFIVLPQFTAHSYIARMGIGWLLCIGLIVPNFSEFLRWLKEFKCRGKLATAVDICILVVSVSFVIEGLLGGNMTYCIMGGTILVCGKLLQYEFTYEDSLEYISKAMLMATAGFIVLSLLFGHPINNRQFGGVTGNQNELGFMCIVFLPGMLYGLNKHKSLIWKIGLSVIVSFALLSRSRTALLSMIFELGVYFALILLINGKSKDVFKRYLKNILEGILIFVLSFTCVFALFTTVKDYEAKALPSIQIYTDKSISFPRFVYKMLGRYSAGMEDNSNDSLTSGRMGIWKDFIGAIELKGHPQEEREITSGTRHYDAINSHNSFIQVAYDAGLIAGISMLAMCIIAGIACILRYISMLKAKENNEKRLFGMLSIFGFGMVSLISVSFIPFVHLTATFFYAVMEPILCSNPERK